MKSKAIFVGILLSIIFIISSHAQQDEIPVLKGPYLGQKPPGKIPELFAPGIISVDANFEHSAAVFAPDGSEIFWCTNINWYTNKRVVGNLRLYYMKIVDGKWTAPQIAPFTKNIRVERPVFSPDGSKLYIEYFSDPNTESDTDIFVVEKIGEGWSKPKPVSPLINSTEYERLHCISDDGSLYFTRNLMMNGEAVYVSRLVDGEFTEPEKLGEDFNSDAHELAIVFGPEEKYFLIYQTKNRQSELFICYKRPDGSWTDKIKINPPYHCGGFLSLSPDGEYLFFLNEGICWMSTSFVEDMKPRNLK